MQRSELRRDSEESWFGVKAKVREVFFFFLGSTRGEWLERSREQEIGVLSVGWGRRVEPGGMAAAWAGPRNSIPPLFKRPETGIGRGSRTVSGQVCL
jgi:hypothetical protein